MTQKEKLLRKERVKKFLFKTLHIICYILSVLFIIVCVVSGVKSCEKQPQQVNAEEDTYSLNLKKALKNEGLNIDDVYFYQLKDFDFVNGVQLSIDTQKSFNPSIDFDRQYTGQQPNIDQDFTDIFSGSYGYNLYGLYSIESCYCRYSSYVWPSYYDYSYRLNSIAFLLGQTNWALVYKANDGGTLQNEDLNYIFGSHRLTLVFTKQIVNVPFFDYFFERIDHSTFIFNKQFNYNAPLGTNLQGLYGSASFDSSGENMRYKNFNVGYFYSNGQIYNQIQYWAIQSAGNTVYGRTNTGSDGLIAAPTGYWIYSFMYYRNTDTNTEILVNYHDTQPYVASSSTSLYYANSSTWVNDQFRYVTFFDNLSDSLKVSINAFNNNNQSYYSGQIYTDGYDVFTLLSFAFSSLSDFWQMNILPGISIGVLFFLPAVVGIIITIVHLLRK